MIFLTAFLTGLLGSFHCAGMCGPIALATPTVGITQMQKLFGKALYNFGRITTYSILGLLLGLFGFGLKLAGLQQSISIIAGAIIIISVLLSKFGVYMGSQNLMGLISGSFIAKLFQRKTYSALFLIGLLNGILPCGFVYIGLIGAVATQSYWQGALFMALFGLGTLPMMFGISVVGQFLSLTTRAKVNKLTPVFAIVIGCIFILRGLNLGIPYVSPKISNDQNVVKECCKPN